MSSPEHKQKIWNIIKEIKVGMLTTQDGEHMRSRPMYLVQDAYDGTIWFYTNNESDKIGELKKDQHVNLVFANPDEDTYVSMCGTANITNDQALIDKYWNPFVDAWFPEGKDSGKVSMVEIKIHGGEHWDNDNSQIVQAFKMIKSSITDTKPDMGENEKFGVA